MNRLRFVKQSEIEAPVEDVFAYHETPTILKDLMPPWEKAEVVKAPESLKVGTRTIVKLFFGPFSRLWIAEHTEYIPNRLFADVQRSGPFAYWYHRHRFEPTSRGTTIYTDEVEYSLPLGRIGNLLAGRLVRARLQRLFDYRHGVVAEKVKRVKSAG